MVAIKFNDENLHFYERIWMKITFSNMQLAVNLCGKKWIYIPTAKRHVLYIYFA